MFNQVYANVLQIRDNKIIAIIPKMETGRCSIKLQIGENLWEEQRNFGTNQ